MKKLKLFATISSLCLAVAVLCFGVFSAVNVTYTINGSISYEVNDVFVQIETKVYRSKAKQAMDLQTLKTTAQTDFENKTFSEIDTTKYELYKDDIETFSSLNATEEPATGSAENININYNQSYQYYIVVNIKSYTSDLKTFALVNKVTEGENSNVYTTPYANDIIKPENVTFDDATNKGKTLVIAYGINDPKTSVGNDNSFEYSIKVEKGEYIEDTSTYADEGLYFDFNEDGKTVTLSSYSGSATEVSIPATVGDFLINKEAQTYILNSLNEFISCPIATSIDGGEISFFSVKIGDEENKLVILNEFFTLVQGNLGEDGNTFKKPLTLSLDIECPKDKYEEYGQTFFNQLNTYIKSNITFDIQLGAGAITSCTSLNTVNNIKSMFDSTDETKFPIKVLNSNLNKKGFKNGNLYKVTKIGEKAFYDNKEITSVTIPSGVVEIGKDTFGGCKNLADLKIPSTVNKIGIGSINSSGLFANYKYDENGLGFLYASDNKNVKFWLGIKKNTKIENITEQMLEGVKFIDEDALEHRVEYNAIDYHGASYVKSIEIPASVVGLIGNPISGCVLNSIKVDKNNKYYTSGNNNNYLLEIESGKYMKSVNISTPEIPNDGSVISIENSTFSNCDNITSITLPSGLKSIGNGSFSDCSKLTSLKIPSSVVVIYGPSFYGCDALASLEFEDVNNWHNIYTGDLDEYDYGVVEWSSTDFAANINILKSNTQLYTGIGYLIKKDN